MVWFIYKLKKVIGSKQCFSLILQGLVVGVDEFQWGLHSGIDGHKLVGIVQGNDIVRGCHIIWSSFICWFSEGIIGAT